MALPISGVGFVGLGMYSIYLADANYLTDLYEVYAVSALSAVLLCWSTFRASLSLTNPVVYISIP